MGTIKEGKVEVVETVRERIDGATATLVTEYRGLTVAEMAALRRALRAVGGDYKVYKNTLVRRAISGGPHEPLSDLLVGPTAIAFVSGDVSAVAKALRDFAKGAPSLVLKGGVLDGKLLGSKELGALAELPSREILLSMFAGALAAPMRTMAGLLKAVPQNLAYGIAALIEQQGGVVEHHADAPAAAATTDEAAPADEATATAEPDDATAPAEADAAPAGSTEAAADEPAVDEPAADEPSTDAPAGDEVVPEAAEADAQAE